MLSEQGVPKHMRNRILLMWLRPYTDDDLQKSQLFLYLAIFNLGQRIGLIATNLLFLLVINLQPKILLNLPEIKL